MNYEHIITGVFSFLFKLVGVYLAYLLAKVSANGNANGHRPWDRPATIAEKIKIYALCLGGAGFAACFAGERDDTKYSDDDAAVVFLVLSAATLLGAYNGFVRALPPPKSIREAIQRLDTSSWWLVHPVAS